MNRHVHRIRRAVRSVTYALRGEYLHTGERCCPEFPDEIFENQFKVYRFVSQFCREQRVLDVGCGTGYGTAYLSQVARQAIGVDISGQAIRYARKHFTNSGLQFAQMNAERLAFPERAFDLVISSENLEHLSNQKANLCEMARILTDEGLAVIGTPNAEMFVGLANRYHTHEFSYRELCGAVGTFFSEYAIAETMLEPPSAEGRRMQAERHEMGEYGLDLVGSPVLWGRKIDTTSLSNTHSFLCFAKSPKRGSSKQSN